MFRMSATAALVAATLGLALLAGCDDAEPWSIGGSAEGLSPVDQTTVSEAATVVPPPPAQPDPKAGNNALVFAQTCGGSQNYIDDALTLLGVPYTVASSKNDFFTKLSSSSYNLVFFEYYGTNLTSANCSALVTAFQGSKKGSIAYSGMNGSAASGLRSYFKISSATTVSSPLTLYLWNNNARFSALYQGPNPIKNGSNLCSDDGDHFKFSSPTTALFGKASAPSKTGAVVLLQSAGNVFLNGAIPGIYKADLNSNGRADGIDLYAAEAAYLLGAANGTACGSTADCASGYCTDGVCCDQACGNGAATDCQACSIAAGAAANGACGPVQASANYVCRAAAGACDIVDKCGGTSTSCPADAKSTAVCRSAASECDVTESCDGASNNCPADALKPNGAACGDNSSGACDDPDTCDVAGACQPNHAPDSTVCRAAAGECDLAELCSAGACPADLKSSAICRPAEGECDAVEYCDGTADACPTDCYKPDGTLCGEESYCEQGECLGCAPQCQGKQCGPDGCGGTCGTCADDGNACTIEYCTSDGSCSSEPAAAGTVCRSYSGGCDVAEVCDGSDDPCPYDRFDPACECPQYGPISGYTDFSGLRAIAPENFALIEEGDWDEVAEYFDALGLQFVDPARIEFEYFGSAPDLPLEERLENIPGYLDAFIWEDEDQQALYWKPLGVAEPIDDSALLAVSWRYDPSHIDEDPYPPEDGSDKGVRVSFVDLATLADDVAYQHVLLVQPSEDKGFDYIDFSGGGIAWHGPYLYVADAYYGIRAFDLRLLIEASVEGDCAYNVGLVEGQACAYGNRYILPQVGGYFFPSGQHSSCRPRFSFLSLDWTSNPESILSGEYKTDSTNGMYARMFRWPLDSQTSHLVTGSGGAARPTQAWYAGNRYLQGVACRDDEFYFNSTRFEGALFTGRQDQQTAVYRADEGLWAWLPRGLSLSPDENLWSVASGHSEMERAVFAVSTWDECGDGACSHNETCDSCVSDCGACDFSYVAWGDTKEKVEVLSELSDQLAGADFDFTLYTGDLEPDGFTAEQIATWTSALNGELTGDTSSNGLFNYTFSVRGNHDKSNTAGWQAYFNFSAVAAQVGAVNFTQMPGMEDLVYSFDYGNSHFVGLDILGDADKISAAQIAWLDDDLYGAEARGKRHMFLFYHGTIYPVDGHCDCPVRVCALPAIVQQWVEVLNDHPLVSAVYNGHEHVYAYTRLDSTRIPADGGFEGITSTVHQFTVADAGSGPDYCKSWRSNFCHEQHGYTIVSVAGARVWVAFYEIGNVEPYKVVTYDN